MARSFVRFDNRKTGMFTAKEKRTIADWSGKFARDGLVTEFERYEVPREILVVSEAQRDDPVWLVHKTPDDKIAVRLWPGLADIVATLPEALALVADAVKRGDP